MPGDVQSPNLVTATRTTASSLTLCVSSGGTSGHCFWTAALAFISSYIFYCFVLVDTGSHCVAQAVLELTHEDQADFDFALIFCPSIPSAGITGTTSPSPCTASGQIFVSGLFVHSANVILGMRGYHATMETAMNKISPPAYGIRILGETLIVTKARSMPLTLTVHRAWFQDSPQQVSPATEVSYKRGVKFTPPTRLSHVLSIISR